MLVRKLSISPLIVTLAMLALYGGFAFVVSSTAVYGFPTGLLELGRGKIFGIQYTVVIAVAVFVIGSFILTRTVTGLRIYAIGGDQRAAELCGVPVGRTVVGLYAANGLLIGLVAVLVAGRLGSITPTIGARFELDVLTAAILGGVAFSGGAGRPLGIAIGVATIGILNAGLIFVGLQSWWQSVAVGGMLLASASRRSGRDRYAWPSGEDGPRFVERRRQVRRDTGHKGRCPPGNLGVGLWQKCMNSHRRSRSAVRESHMVHSLHSKKPLSPSAKAKLFACSATTAPAKVRS